MFDRVNMGKVYVGMIIISLLLGCLFIYRSTGARSVVASGTSDPSASEQVLGDAQDAVVSWAKCFYTTNNGKDAWIASLSAVSTPDLMLEIEQDAAGQRPSSQPEYMKRALSFIDAKKEQFVTITLNRIEEKDAGFIAQITVEERQNTILSQVQYLLTVVHGDDGKMKVASVYSVDMSGL